jgi:hypothetical protein
VQIVVMDASLLVRSGRNALPASPWIRLGARRGLVIEVTAAWAYAERSL